MMFGWPPQVENGDLNWIIEGKFLAFAGPHNSRDLSPEGYYTLTPEDYGHYFVKNNVSLVVRLNKKYYDEQVRHSLVKIWGMGRPGIGWTTSWCIQSVGTV